MYVTNDLLERLGACRIGLEIFNILHPNGMKTTLENLQSYPYAESLSWLNERLSVLFGDEHFAEDLFPKPFNDKEEVIYNRARTTYYGREIYDLIKRHKINRKKILDALR